MTAMVHLGMIATLTLIVPGSSARTLNATEVEGLVVRESNASTACGPGPAAGRGCARVAVLLTAGFHDVRYGIGHRFDGRQNVDPGHPLLAAWLRTTSLSLRRHIVEPNRADVFIYSWNPSLADAFDKLYAPVRAAFARNAPLMRNIKRGALAGCPLVNAVLRCSENAVSWAYTIREAEVLLSGHERARGFEYDVVVFARPDIILFADVDARELVDARTVVMPSPNRGDHFFMMHRRTASVFATAFDVAAIKPGCAVGCVDADSLKAIGQTSGRAWAHADMQLWKSAFLTLRAKATLRPSKNKQPEHVAPYRTFGLTCERQPRDMFPEAAAMRAELDAIAIDDRLLDLTIDAHRAAEPRRAFCPWLCAAFPNRTRVKCPGASAAGCCRHGPSYLAKAPATQRPSAAAARRAKWLRTLPTSKQSRARADATAAPPPRRRASIT